MQVTADGPTQEPETTVQQQAGRQLLPPSARADPREWPRLRSDRLRTPPRYDPPDTEEELARWRRRDRIERAVGVVAVAIAFAIPLAILGVIGYALQVKLRPDGGWNSSILPMVLMVVGAVVLLLAIVLVFDLLSARDARRTLRLENETPSDERTWTQSSPEVEVGSAPGPDVPGVERLKQVIAKVGRRQSRY
jgi:hypothetical protein